MRCAEATLIPAPPNTNLSHESINFNDPETNEREYDRDEDDRGSYAGGNYCEYGSARDVHVYERGEEADNPPLPKGATQRHLRAGVHPAIGPRRHLGQGDMQGVATQTGRTITCPRLGAMKNAGAYCKISSLAMSHSRRALRIMVRVACFFSVPQTRQIC